MQNCLVSCAAIVVQNSTSKFQLFCMFDNNCRLCKKRARQLLPTIVVGRDGKILLKKSIYYIYDVIYVINVINTL